MSGLLALILMFLAVVVPVAGAFTLRLFAPRLSQTVGIGIATLLFALATISAVVLAFDEFGTLRIGDLIILQPVGGISVDPPTR
jgi:hypothetical protein